MSTETETDERLERLRELVLRTPTFEISYFAGFAILGLFAYATAHMGMTPEQAAVWSEHGVPDGRMTAFTIEYAVRPPYWKIQAQAGQLLFMLAAFGEAAHHLAEKHREARK